MSETYTDDSVAHMVYDSAMKTWTPTPVAQQTVAATTLTVSNPPTQAEVQAIVTRVEAIRSALAAHLLTKTS